MPFERAAQGHESAVGPAVDADARRVGIGLRRHVAGQRELILDFERAQPSVGLFLEFLAPETRAASVGADHDIALVGQRVLPVERPAVAHRLRTGTRILRQQDGVALRRVEAAGLDDVGVERVAALGGEGEELLLRAVRGGQLIAQGLAVGQQADRVALAVADLDPVGGRGVGEGRYVVFHVGARRDRIEAFARGQAAFLRAVEPHAVEVAAQGGGLSREVPHALAVGARDVGHLPVALGHLREETPADAVEVEVHVSRVALLPYEEAVFVHERERGVVHALDVLLRTFVVDRPLGAVRLAENHLEGVLAAVEPEEVEPPVGGPADAGDVLVGFAARVDALFGAGREVADPHFDRRIAFAGLGVFERVGLIVELAVEAHHLHQWHLRFVEAQVGDAAAVGRKGIGFREAELLLVNPVGRAVDDRIPRTVVGDAARLPGGGVVNVKVVAVRIGDQSAVGRERSVARGFGLPEYGRQAVARSQKIAGRIGVAVDRLRPRSDQYLPLVGREGVVGDRQVGRGRREHPLARSRRGVAVADDVAAFERVVVLAVGHRADAADGLVHAPQSGDFGVFVLGLYDARSEQCGRKERN